MATSATACPGPEAAAVTSLVVLDVPAGPGFVTALRRVWDRGDAALPLDQRLPAAAKAAVVASTAPSSSIDAAGDEHPIGGGAPMEPGDALVVATSGTTGAPRGVVLTHAAVEASARAVCARLGAGADDHWLACLPLSHVGGLSVVTRALVTGARVSVHERFDAAAVMAAARAGATLVSLVPTTLARIDPSLFRWIVLGGSRPPEHRPANVVATYGMTETGSGVVYDGVPLDGVDVDIAPDGQIRLRGPMLMRAYRDGHDPRDSDGFLPTGDIGEWSADGRLRVLGRRDDMIITGGENVWPDAVEAALADLPGVAEVAVAGVADAEWGSIVTAWIVPMAGATPPTLAEVRAHTRRVLPAYAAPRAIRLVDALPRTPLGKVRRRALTHAR